MSRLILFLVCILFHCNVFSSTPDFNFAAKNMLFPVHGDGEGYLMVGKAIATHAQSASIVDALLKISDSIRPWGAYLYISIPFILTEDPVLRNHYIVLFNLIATLTISAFFLGYLKYNGLSAKTFGVIGIVSLCAVPFVPILMSDLISLCFFILGIACFNKASENFKQNLKLTISENIWLFIAGIMFALSVLLKQNYFVYTGFLLLSFIFVYRTIFFNKANLSSNLISSGFMLLGFSFCLTQFFVIYYTAGVFWLYNPATLAHYAPSNIQPWLELIAYNIPDGGAYLLSLDTPVNHLTFVLTRLYLGMTKFYLPIYHGFIPTKGMIYKLTLFKTCKIYLFFTLFTLFTFYSYKKLSEMSKILILSSFLIAIFTAITIHTENRYYLPCRMIYLLFIVEITSYCVKKLCSKGGWKDILSFKQI